jgi:molecular chaperone Hsp33
MAASVLMAGSLKFEGRLSLQIEGAGALRLLLAQCNHRHAVRGVARHLGVPSEAAGIAALCGHGRLAVTIEQEGRADNYQGVVPLEKPELSACLEQYFERSEQLPSRLLLAATPERAAGLLLQRVATGEMEAQAVTDDAWRRIGWLAATLSTQELLGLPCRELLRRVFPEDDIRLFAGTPVWFQCTCSRERVAGILQSLGEDELRALLRERDDVEVRCEFCNRAWRFDAVDVTSLFAIGSQPGAARGLH